MALILPPLRRTENDAFRFARVVHANQTDKAGRPYLGHLSRVQARVFALSAGCPFWNDMEVDEAQQVAWLHDAVEDGKTTEGRLRDEGFSSRVTLAVAVLTKEGDQSYNAFIESIFRGPFLSAILVKLADVEDNSDPERLALLSEETRDRLLRKYAGAADLLRQAARTKGWQG